MNSIIETKDLKLWYGDHQVLKGITMDIPGTSDYCIDWTEWLW